MRGARKDSKDEGKGEAVAEGRASACRGVQVTKRPHGRALARKVE